VDTAHPLPITSRRLMTFVRHFVEMCISMCVGVGLTLGVVAVLGGDGFRASYPALSLVLVASTITAPMTAWMVLRGMPRRPILEMTATSFVVVAALIVAGVAGIGPGTAATVGDVCGFSCGAMLMVMAARFDLYAGGHH
jgi:hypothetical protein